MVALRFSPMQERKYNCYLELETTDFVYDVK